MKCEICNQGDLIKKDGVFVCENCGTKYTPEELQKTYMQTQASSKTAETHPGSNTKEKPSDEAPTSTFNPPNSPAESNSSANDKPKLYVIDTYTGYTLPKNCPCCMSLKTQPREFVLSSSTRGLTHRASYSFNVKYRVCPECQAHRERISRCTSILGLISIVFGIAVYLILMATIFKGKTKLLPLAIGPIFTFLLYYLLTSLVHLPTLSHEHSSYDNFIKVESDDMPTGSESYYAMHQKKSVQRVRFTFTNEKYASLFAEMNPDYIISYETKESPFDTDPRTAESIKKGRGIILLISFIIILIISFI